MYVMSCAAHGALAASSNQRVTADCERMHSGSAAGAHHIITPSTKPPPPLQTIFRCLSHRDRLDASRWSMRFNSATSTCPQAQSQPCLSRYHDLLCSHVATDCQFQSFQTLALITNVCPPRAASRTCHAPHQDAQRALKLFFSPSRSGASAAAAVPPNMVRQVSSCCVERHTSHDTRHTSHVARRTSHVARHTTHVTRHTSHVARRTSHVTPQVRNVFKFLTALGPGRSVGHYARQHRCPFNPRPLHCHASVTRHRLEHTCDVDVRRLVQYACLQVMAAGMRAVTL
jgi:hypothetical protein